MKNKVKNIQKKSVGFSIWISNNTLSCIDLLALTWLLSTLELSLKQKNTTFNCWQFSEVLDSSTSKIIYIVAKEESFRKLKALLKLNGLSVSANSDTNISEVKKRKPLARLIDIEQLDTTVMRDFETVLLPDFVPSLETYVQILTSMARDSVHGVLHSFLTEKEAVSYPAGSLVNVLEDCGQKVPDPWRNMYVSMSD